MSKVGTMIILKRIFLISLFLIIIALSVWFVSSSYQLMSPIAATHTPDTFAENLRAYKLDRFGQLHWTLSADHAVHYADTDTTTFFNPFFIFYPQGEPAWHIKAKQADATHDESTITLINEVNVQQLPGLNSNDMTLLTSKLILYPDQSIAKTDQPVTVIRANNIIQAVGMLANFKTNAVQFMSHMQGVYDKESTKGNPAR